MLHRQCRYLPTGGRLRFSLHSFARSDGIRAHSHAIIELLGGEDWGGPPASSWAECMTTCVWLGPPHLCVLVHVNIPRFPSDYSQNILYSLNFLLFLNHSGNNTLRPNKVIVSHYKNYNGIASLCYSISVYVTSVSCFSLLQLTQHL